MPESKEQSMEMSTGITVRGGGASRRPSMVTLKSSRHKLAMLCVLVVNEIIYLPSLTLKNTR